MQDALYAALGATGAPSGKVGPGTIVGITLAAALIAAAVGLAVHKLRMRHVMQSEIRSIMSQYMPLARPCCNSDPCSKLHALYWRLLELHPDAIGMQAGNV